MRAGKTGETTRACHFFLEEEPPTHDLRSLRRSESALADGQGVDGDTKQTHTPMPLQAASASIEPAPHGAQVQLLSQILIS
jgi:hypothetical protein